MRVLNILRNVGPNELIIPFITEDQWHIFGLCSRSMKWLIKFLFHKKKEDIVSTIEYLKSFKSFN